MDEGLHAGERQPGELGEHLLEHGDVAGQERAQDEPGGELAACAQVAHERPRVGIGTEGGDRDGAPVAGVPHHLVRPAAAEPFAVDHEVGEQRRQHPHQHVTRRHRQVGAREHRLADGADASKPGDEAIERGRRKRRVRIFQRDEAGFDRADLGERSHHCALQRRAGGDRGLEIAAARGDDPDELGIDQERRARQHQRGDVGMVGGERVDHGMGRIGASRQRFGKRLPHQRRGIVEQHDHGALGGGPIFLGEVGIEIGPRKSPGRLGALTGRSGAHPVEELTDDH